MPHHLPDDLSIEDFTVADQQRYLGTQDREQTRRTIAFNMLWLIAALSIGIVTATVFGFINLDEAKDLSSATIAPLLTIFGTVVGFFFGSSSLR